MGWSVPLILELMRPGDVPGRHIHSNLRMGGNRATGPIAKTQPMPSGRSTVETMHTKGICDMSGNQVANEKLVAIDGPNGRFEIGLKGGERDFGLGFQYRDVTHWFVFFAGVGGQPTMRAEVTMARVLPGNAPLKLGPTDEARIQENIRFYFKTRRWIFPDQYAQPGESVDPVVFTWRVAQ